MVPAGSLWIVFTVLAAAGQTVRNAMQRELTAKLGTVGATHVRFLFGFPFALVFLAGVMTATGYAFPKLPPVFWPWAIVGAGAIGGWIGVHLARAGAQLSVLARGDTLAALQRQGLQLHQGGQHHSVAVRASQDAAELGVQCHLEVLHGGDAGPGSGAQDIVVICEPAHGPGRALGSYARRRRAASPPSSPCRTPTR